MESVDRAFKKTCDLLAEWRSGEGIHGAALSESDTRAKIIDPIFRDILEWPERYIVREEPAGEGFADYVLRDQDRPYALVEAKRVVPRFQLPQRQGRSAYLVGGPVLNSKHIREAIQQAAGYGPILGCPYAVVTNGFQFVVFQAITATPLRDRSAIVFGDLEDPQQFRDFYELLCFQNVADSRLQQRFLEFQAVEPRQVARDRLQHPDRELTRNRLWSVLSHLATRVLEDRPESRLDIISNCYVATRESQETDRELRDLIERRPSSLVTDMGGLPAGNSTRSGIGRVLETAIKDRRAGVYVLTGGAGSGKTTFLGRFQHIVAPELAGKWCSWFHVDFLPSGRPVQGTQGTIDVEAFIYRSVREQIVTRYSSEISTDGGSLRKMFDAELQELEATLLYDVPQDSDERRKLISAEIYQLFRSDVDFCKAAIRRLTALGRRPVFVLDNSDQLGEEFQESVFLSAKAIQDQFSAICIVSLREEKFYAAYYRGVFNAFPTHKFYIGSPDLQEVLKKRLDYGVSLLNANPGDFFPEADEEWAGGSKALSLEDCLALLQVFIKSVTSQNRNIVRMLESVAAGNIRFGLEVFRDFVGSGNTKVGEILRIFRQSGNYTVSFHQFAKSVMLGNREFYRSGNSPIINVYAVSSASRASHFTALRILRYLHDRQNAASAHGTGFVETLSFKTEYVKATDLAEDFDQTLAHLIRKDLIESEPPRSPSVDVAEACKIGASGSYYLRYLAQSFAYLDLISYDAAITDPRLVNYLVTVAHMEDIQVRLQRVEEVLEYLIRAEAEEVASIPHGSPFAVPLMTRVAEQVRKEMEVIRIKTLPSQSS